MANGSPRVKSQKLRSVRMKSVFPNDMMARMEERFYREVNPRREQEIMDSRMIQEDHSAIANLSPRFINRQWDPDKYMQSLGKKDEMFEIGGK